MAEILRQPDVRTLRELYLKYLERFRPRIGLMLMWLAVLVGALTGFAAVCFIWLIEYIQHLAYNISSSQLPWLGNWLFLLVPVAGALIVGPLIAFYASEARGHGVPEVMQALVLHGGRIRPRVAIAKIIASALCIGTGGSAGREGPIVQAGSALGSSLGQLFGFSDERIKNLVSCGAAAGIAATFNAPIAGVAFATEVLMTELQGKVFGNVVVSAVSASVVSQIFLGARPAFDIPFYNLNSPWEIFLYAALGVIAAFVGVFFIRLLNYFEVFFDKLQVPAFIKPALGAFLLGLIGLVYFSALTTAPAVPEPGSSHSALEITLPHIYGSGFLFIEDVLHGVGPLHLLIMLIFLKPLATSLTLGSGNSGGVFAPSLFTGAMLGGAFGSVMQSLFPNIAGEVGGYALVGMAAVFAAAARAPLTAMLIVFEMSNDYYLILPLMVAGIMATFIAHWMHPESIYTLKLVNRGIRFDQGRDLDVMQGVTVAEVMNQDPVIFYTDQPVSDLFAMFQETHLMGFPVVTRSYELYGIVTMQDMNRILSKTDTPIKEMKVRDVATRNPVTVYDDDPIWLAIQKMSPRDLARLPVLSHQHDMTLVGLISRSDILRAYQVGIMRKQQAQYARERMALRKVSEIEFIEIAINEGNSQIGKKIFELSLPKDANIVSVERNGAVLIPHGDTEIMKNDHFTILCRSNTTQQTRMALGK